MTASLPSEISESRGHSNQDTRRFAFVSIPELIPARHRIPKDAGQPVSDVTASM